MNAVLLLGHGGYDQLQVRDDVPVPTPAPGEVLVRVGACGVNNTDINTRIGWYSKSVSSDTEGAVAHTSAGADADGSWTGTAFAFPRIQGADACGSIVAVGAEVETARIGERVLVDPVLRGPAGNLDHVGFLGADRDGAFAEYVTVPAGNAWRVTSEFSDIELASFPCAYSAAENMIERAGITNGETVLVTGASGGVGSAAIQLASRRGARVIAVANPAKTVALNRIGAEAVLPRDADVVGTLGRESIDAVIDVVGGNAFPALLDVLRRGGRYAVAGAIGGPLVELDLRTVYLKDLRLLGCTATAPGLFENIVRYIESRTLVPLVSAMYPLAEIAVAQADFLRKAHMGKIVLVP